LLVLHKDGTYRVVHIPEKQYFENTACVKIADKKTVVNVVYRNKETQHTWAKRFIVDKFILDKVYRYFDENAELLHISTKPNAVLELVFAPQKRQKVKQLQLVLEKIPIKGVQTRGIRVATHKIKKIV
jgi:topoisomerase-4 subunit A